MVCHGTGVRNHSFASMLELVRSKIKEFGLPCRVHPCLWGDALGIDFEGLSLPEPPQLSAAERQEALRWQYLEVDPLFELRLWCTPAAPVSKFVLGRVNAGKRLWAAVIEPYLAGEGARDELWALLKKNGVLPLFRPAWEEVVSTGLPKEAFAAAEDESSAVARVFAGAVAAQMIHDAASASPMTIVSVPLAQKIVERLLFDWEQVQKGLVGDLLLKFFGGATRAVVRPLRTQTSCAIAPALGDVLRYQGVGAQIRELIHRELAGLSGDVFVLGHSLGGIACFEMMVEARGAGQDALPQVKGLITAGSQAPLLYEFDALQTVRLESPRQVDPLPKSFPPWLNLYDQNDVLSYRASRLFPRAKDVQVDCLLPPLQAHSAYWTLDITWRSVGSFMAECRG